MDVREEGGKTLGEGAAGVYIAPGAQRGTHTLCTGAQARAYVLRQLENPKHR